MIARLKVCQQILFIFNLSFIDFTILQLSIKTKILQICYLLNCIDLCFPRFTISIEIQHLFTSLNVNICHFQALDLTQLISTILNLSPIIIKLNYPNNFI